MTAKRVAWVLGAAVALAVAGYGALKLYDIYFGPDQTQPGIIFERADRPAKA
jgi:hypothetical protein